MPVRRRQGKRRRTELTLSEELELMIGPGGQPSAFSSEEERRALYEANRDELLAHYADLAPGRRPLAWWELESPAPRDPGVPEGAQLLALDALDDGEEDALLRRWADADAAALVYAATVAPGGGQHQRQTYLERRRWLGVPDDFEAPHMNATEEASRR